MKHIAAVIIVTAVLLFTQTYAFVRGEENEIPQLVDMTPCCRGAEATVCFICCSYGRGFWQSTV